jgi:hypothetical protein
VPLHYIKYCIIGFFSLDLCTFLLLSPVLMICFVLFRPVVPGVPWHPQILADQLTLPQWADYAHQIVLAPPDF